MTDIQDKLLKTLSSEIPTFDASIPNIFDKTFTEIGLDSLDVFSFISVVELDFNIKIDDEDLSSLTSLSLLEQFIVNNGDFN